MSKIKKDRSVWKTKKEFNKWMDAYEEQQIKPVVRLMALDNAVNKHMEQGCLSYPEAFDKVYTIDVLKELGYLDKGWKEPETILSMSEVLADIDNKYTVLVEKPTNETLLNEQEI
tara:strand:+ start:181 stop:525 length:345 start_codon:yes stop_codon:yes gene_type:complete